MPKTNWNYENEKNKLIENLKKFKLNGEEDDLSLEKMIEMKEVFKSINNLVTSETTRRFSEKLIEGRDFADDTKELLREKVSSTNPNANGFDLEFSDGEFKFIAEVKCNIPVKGEDGFGTAQKNAIKKDLGYLVDPYSKKYRENKNSSYSDYYRFLVFLDCGKGTRCAVDKLIEEWNRKSNIKAEIEFRLDALTEKKDEIIYVVLIDSTKDLRQF